jgi:hypothetical protein
VTPDREYSNRVVSKALVCVAIQIKVRLPESRESRASGNMIPELFEVFLIQRLKVTGEPAGMIPAALGTPSKVFQLVMLYSPGAAFLRFGPNFATLAWSGLAVFM